MDEERELVMNRLTGWVSGSGLESWVEDGFDVIHTWVSTCAPAHANAEDRALASMDLYLGFLYLDDYEGSDYAAVYRRLARVLDGEPGEPDESVVTRLYREQRQRVAQRAASTRDPQGATLSMHRYLDERRQALVAYERRNRLFPPGSTPTFEALAEVRDVTILFRVWYSLWEILCGHVLDERDYAESPFSLAIASVCRWQVLINELHSLDRDERTGTPNLIHCLERERGLSRRAAIDEVRVEMDRLAATTARAQTELGERARSPSLAWAFEFLEANMAGARTLYAHKLERYQTSAQF